MKLKKIWLILWFIFCAAAVVFLIASQYLPNSAAFWLEIKNNNSAGLPENPIRSNGQAPLPDNTGQNINFLLLGAPGEGNDAPDLTDTIIVAHFDSHTQKIYLFSLPRDLWVKMPNGNFHTKINALYAYNKKNGGHEFDAIRAAAEEITGLPIDHYIFIDLSVLRTAIDTLGGVNVMVKKDISDEQFPGPNHSFQTFEIKAGWRFLDGETALKYARTRHEGAGDFDRVERQQEILQALKQKILGLRFWNFGTYFSLYQNISDHVKTDLNLWQLKNYYEDVKNIPGENIIKSELTSAGLFSTGPANLGSQTASIVKPKVGIGNYEEIRKFIAEAIKN